MTSYADVFAGSTLVHGNMETPLIDPGTDPGAPYAWEGDWPLVCDPAAVADPRAFVSESGGRWHTFGRAISIRRICRDPGELGGRSYAELLCGRSPRGA